MVHKKVVCSAPTKADMSEHVMMPTMESGSDHSMASQSELQMELPWVGSREERTVW